MEVFRDLFIRGDPDRLAETMEAIEQSLTNGWTRDRAIELSLQGASIRDEKWYGFTCTKDGSRPAATVFFTHKDRNTLYVSNIVPRTEHQLARGQYNTLLEEFCERFVRPAAARTGVTVELTGTEADLEHWLSPPTAEKLRRFSAAANKSTGSSHPSDQMRWMDFLIAAHGEGSTLNASFLRRWLIEIEHWPPEVAEQLAIEYEFGRDLLSFAESQRRSA